MRARETRTSQQQEQPGKFSPCYIDRAQQNTSKTEEAEGRKPPAQGMAKRTPSSLRSWWMAMRSRRPIGALQLCGPQTCVLDDDSPSLQTQLKRPLFYMLCSYCSARDVRLEAMLHGLSFRDRLCRASGQLPSLVPRGVRVDAVNLQSRMAGTRLFL